MARDSSGSQNQPGYATTGAPADAADLTEVANYAALVGNRKKGTTIQRNAATGADVWEGLSWHDTTDNGRYEYIGGGWVRRQVIYLGSARYNAAGTLVATPAWTDLLTITATSTGGLCMVDFSASAFNGASGANRDARYQIVCDGVQVWDQWRSDVILTGGSIGVNTTGYVESTPGVGSHTWKLQANASAAPAVQVRNATMKILEV